MEHPPLEIFKIQLDRALDNKDAFNGKLDQMISRNPFQPRLFYHFFDAKFHPPNQGKNNSEKLQMCHAATSASYCWVPKMVQYT